QWQGFVGARPSGPTLLTLALFFYVCRNGHPRPSFLSDKDKSKIKNVGQECPTHTFRTTAAPPRQPPGSLLPSGASARLPRGCIWPREFPANNSRLSRGRQSSPLLSIAARAERRTKLPVRQILPAPAYS